MGTAENRLKGSSAVQVSELGFEDGSKRFRDPRHPDIRLAPPRPCIWRNNLTALSQRYNLYFVANQDAVHVFRPSFPFQTLGGEPDLIFKPPFAVVAPGYLDETVPHGINHMIVGDLGTEEILLMCCDDGNVSAFHTRAILDEIGRETGPKLSIQRDVRAFFSEHVPRSAWGLAIHSRARMIAVSSNSAASYRVYALRRDQYANITVFAFSLVDIDSDPVSEDAMDSDEYWPRDQGDWIMYDQLGAFEGTVSMKQRRRHNIRINLEGHRQNIPSVAFFNSDWDLEGRWLVSTDIVGKTKVWDVWYSEGSCLSDWAPLPRERNGDSETRGWVVMCLDPRVFRETTTLSETLGIIMQHDGHIQWPIDASASVLRVPNSSFFYPGTMDQNESNPSASLIDDASDDSQQGQDDDSDPNSSHNSPAEYTADIDSLPQFDLAMSSDDSDSDGGVILGGFHHDDHRQDDPADEPDDSEDEPTTEESADNVISARPTSANHGESASQGVSPDQRQTQYATQTRAGSPGSLRRANIPLLPFSLLRTTASSIFLHSDSLSETPTVLCFNCLSQELPEDLAWLYRIDRLNMAIQIQELGVIVVASQAGRAAVFVLTKLKKSNLVGFRIQWILPMKSQEEQGQRPSSPLLGIVAAPIQGREVTADADDAGQDLGPAGLWGMPESSMGFQGKGKKETWRGFEETRRYRLLMTYCDHSVLSYEISRRVQGRKEYREKVDGNSQEDFLML